MCMYEFVEFVVEKVFELGVDYVEVCFEEKNGIELVMKNGNVEGFGIFVDRGIGIRVFVDGGMGFVLINVLMKESVVEVVKKVVKLVKVVLKVRNEFICFFEEDFYEVYYEVKMRKDFWDILLEEKFEFFKKVEEEVKGMGVNVLMCFFCYFDWMWYKIIVYSDGGFVESYILRVFFIYNFVVFENG